MNEENIITINTLRNNLYIINEVLGLLSGYQPIGFTSEDFIDEVYEILENRYESDLTLLEKHEKRFNK